MPLSLFVTGANGYLGRHVLERVDPGRYQRIYCLTKSEGGAHPAPNVTFIRGDLLEASGYCTSLAECNTVLHMAAVTGKARPHEYFRVNREGTRVLVEASRRSGVRRFLFVSSVAAGFHDQRRCYYAQSKRAAEEVVAQSGLEYLIVRPTILMGRGAPVIESLSKLAAAPVTPVFGDGRARVQPVCAGELATYLLNIIEHGGFDNRMIEIGGPEVLTIEDLLLKIRRIRYGKPAHIVHVPAGPVAAILGILERFVLPLLPVTAGQLASFTNDGTATESFPSGCTPRSVIDDALRV